MILHSLGLILNRQARRGVAPSKTLLPPRLRKERGTQGVRLIHKNQRGITLIEIIVAVAIAGIIAGGTATTIYQTVSGNARNGSHMTAVRQVQTAGYWISRDAQMSQTIDSDPEDDLLTPGTEVLILSWEGWEDECWVGSTDTCVDSHEVRYTYDAASEKLWRLETITTAQYDSDGDPVVPQPDPQDSITFIADHITPIDAEDIIINENKLTVTITASVTSWVGEAVEQRTYEITPRPSPTD